MFKSNDVTMLNRRTVEHFHWCVYRFKLYISKCAFYYRYFKLFNLWWVFFSIIQNICISSILAYIFILALIMQEKVSLAGKNESLRRISYSLSSMKNDFIHGISIIYIIQESLKHAYLRLYNYIACNSIISLTTKPRIN